VNVVLDLLQAKMFLGGHASRRAREKAWAPVPSVVRH
jgi:hypothetical protein